MLDEMIWRNASRFAVILENVVYSNFMQLYNFSFWSMSTKTWARHTKMTENYYVVCGFSYSINKENFEAFG